MFGMATPVIKHPVQQRTAIMANHMLAAALRGKCCDSSHLSVRGVTLFTRCQSYMPKLCFAITRECLSRADEAWHPHGVSWPSADKLNWHVGLPTPQLCTRRVI